MAKIPDRMPTPQARQTKQYYAPNPRAPQAPQRPQAPLPYDPAFERAGNRLASALGQYAQVEQKREMDLIDRQEAIRVSKMEDADLQNELRTLAREAEKINAWAISSNPYRIQVGMENIADRIMRTSYAQALEKETLRFADPLNPDSEEQASKFALDTFRELGIEGFWAQSRASEMYDAMASKWLGNVRDKKSQRIQRMAHQDVQDITYRAFNDFLDNPAQVSFDDALGRVSDAASDGYSVTGLSMKDDIAKGLSAAFVQRASEAAREGDVEDIEQLLATLDTIEEIQEGPMSLSKQQGEELGNIRLRLENALENAGDQDRQAIERDEQSADDLGNAWIVSRSGDDMSLPTDLADPDVQDLRKQMRDAGLSETAINNYFANKFRNRINTHLAGGDRPDPAELEEVTQALWNIETHEARKTFIMNSNLPVQTKNTLINASHSQMRNDVVIERMITQQPDGSPRTSIQIANSETELSVQRAADMGGVTDETVLSTFQVNINQWIKAGATAAGKTEYATEAERTAAIDAAVNERAEMMRSVRLNGGMDYDVTRARELGIPESIVRGMETISQEAALAELTARRAPIAGYEDAGDVGLFGGWAWHRALFDYSAEIFNNYTAVLDDPNADALSRQTAITENNRLVEEMVVDAAKVAQQISTSEYGKMKTAKESMYAPSTFEITPKGIIQSVEAVPNRPDVTSATQLTLDFEQAIRIRGLSFEQMRSKNADGLGTEHRPTLTDPYRTGMIPVDSFESDLEQLANVNTPGMTQDELLDQLKGNGIAEGYKAYVDMVGANDAVGFDAFVEMQITGIGRYRLPVPDSNVVRRLNLDTTP